MIVNYDFTQGYWNLNLEGNTNNNAWGVGGIVYAFDGGLFFNGSNSYVGIPNSLIVNSNYNFTISMKFRTWQKSGVLFGYQQYSIEHNGSGSYVPLLYVNSSGYPVAAVYNGNEQTLTGTTYVGDNTWHTAQMTVSGSINSSMVTLTIDGVSMGAISVTGDLTQSGYGYTHYNQIGVGNNWENLSGYQYFNGYIQNFQLYGTLPD